jgi:hypothetical protein
MSTEQYAATLKQVEEDVTTLESLRRSDPAGAAAELVKAHEALATALLDSRRQGSAVSEAVKTFREKAEAVEQAFRNPEGEAS